MSSVSTHFDISPSLLAYLHHNYKTKGPSLVSWIGQGLDTSHNFQNQHKYPLLQTKTDIVILLSKMIFPMLLRWIPNAPDVGYA